MRRVLIVGADFVPSSLPPALRIRFFATHLPEFGWEPIVLTVDPKHYEHPIDWENAALVRHGLRVIRTSAWAASWTRKAGIGDIGMRAMQAHWRAIKQLCRNGEVDLLLIPVPPYVPMILGRMACDRFGIPYVIDYIDPWVTDYYRRVPRSSRPPKWFLADRMSRALEPYALRRVSHITGVSKGTVDGVAARYSWLSSEDGTEIPYGAETADFEFLRANPRANRIFDSRDGLIHLSSVGRGGVDQVPVLRALFGAFRAMLERSPSTFQRVRLHFAGTSYNPRASTDYQVLPLAHEFGLGSIVTEHPPRLAYLDGLQVLLDSHGLLAIGSEEPHYTASKIFPYIMARRPVLAIFHEESSVVRILAETRAGRALTFGMGRPAASLVEDVARALDGLVSLPREYSPDTDWNVFEAYTARSMTRRLAEVFDRAAPAPATAKQPSPDDVAVQQRCD